MHKNYQIHVIGIVQGVWFRKYTREKAISHNLVGFVKNEPDGSVYVEAEGQEADIELFLKWLHKGSPLSKVDKVAWEEGIVQRYSGFKISR